VFYATKVCRFLTLFQGAEHFELKKKRAKVARGGQIRKESFDLLQ
jgi:hypothetical protein